MCVCVCVCVCVCDVLLVDEVSVNLEPRPNTSWGGVVCVCH